MSIPGSASPLLFQSAAAADATFAEIANSLRFNSSDSAYLSRTPSSDGNRKTFTFSCWLKRTGLGGRRTLLRTNSSELHFSFAESAQGNEDAFFCYGAGGSPYLVSNAVFKDVGGWYHFCIAWDTTQSTASNRLKLFVNGVQITSWKTGTFPNQNYQGGLNSATAHGLGANSSGGERFDGYLADVYFIDGTAHDASKFGAYDDNGVWQAITPSGLTYGTNGYHLEFNSTGTTAALGTDTSGNSNTWTANNFSVGTPVYFVGDNSGLDSYIPSGWTNTTDPSNVLSNNNTGVLINQSGSLYFAITPTSSSISIKWIVYDGSGTYNPTVSLNTSSSWNGTTVHPSSTSGNGSSGNPSVGTYSVTSGTTYYVRTGLTGSGNPALVVYITNVTIAAVATDMVPADFSKDSPTTDTTNTDSGAGGQLSGNYAVWNGLPPGGTSTYGTLSNGNLDVSLPASGKALAQTFFPQSGKWYIEIDFVSGGGAGGGLRIGVINEKNIAVDLGSTANSWAYLADGRTYHNNSAPSYGVSSAPGDLLMMALDIDAGKLWYGKNGTWMGSGNPGAGSNPSQTFTAGQKMSFSAQSGAPTTQVINANFGSKAWTYNAPSGFKAVCTTNLPTPTVADGRDYFEAKLWTGNSTDQRAITGYQFSPDLVYIKRRSATYGGIMMDTVRGLNNGHAGTLYTNVTNAEDTGATSSIRSFNTDGFNLGTDGGINYSGSTYVGWAWDAGSSTVNNTDGSITSQVRANPSAGFSIVAYTGNGSSSATVGHGLNAQLGMLIHKRRDAAASWKIKHTSLPTNGQVLFDTAANVDVTGNHGGGMGDLSSSSTFGFAQGLTNVDNVNGNNVSYINYCFAPVEGYSAFGSYEGNGSSDGPFVALSFAPAFVMFKRYDASGDWIIFDNKRNTYPGNFREKVLYPNKNTAEETSANGDTMLFLSNGFKINNVNYAYWNASGGDYLWAAFAENPFQANGGLAR